MRDGVDTDGGFSDTYERHRLKSPMNDLLKRIGERIADARNRRRWTIADLGRESGVKPQTISRWEAGQNVPNCEGIIAVANACGVTTDYLLCRVDHPDQLPPGHWIVDMALIERMRAGDLPSRKDEVLGIPVPVGAAVVNSTEFAKLQLEAKRLVTERGKRK